MSKIILPIGDKIIIPPKVKSGYKMWMGLEDRFPQRILYPRLSKKSILTPGTSSPSASPSSAGWSDNFNGGSGYLNGRSGWTANTYDWTGSKYNSTLVLTNNEIQDHNLMSCQFYNPATYTPVDADYTAQVDVKLSDIGSSERIHAAFVRGTVASNKLSAYVIRIVPATGACGARKVTAGSIATITGSDVTLSGITYTNYNTYALKVSGGATTTLEIFIGGVSKGTWTDATSPFTAAGNAGVTLYGVAANCDLDNFVITD